VAGNRVAGPAIIETPVTTIVLPPRQTATVDAYLNVAIELEASA
jgi:N-methylhydantoinase A